MKDKNPHFQEIQWITGRINSEKRAYLHHREATGNQRDPKIAYTRLKTLSADILTIEEAQEQRKKMWLNQGGRKSVNIELITQHE